MLGRLTHSPESSNMTITTNRTDTQSPVHATGDDRLPSFASPQANNGKQSNVSSVRRWQSPPSASSRKSLSIISTPSVNQKQINSKVQGSNSTTPQNLIPTVTPGTGVRDLLLSGTEPLVDLSHLSTTQSVQNRRQGGAPWPLCDDTPMVILQQLSRSSPAVKSNASPTRLRHGAEIHEQDASDSAKASQMNMNLMDALNEMPETLDKVYQMENSLATDTTKLLQEETEKTVEANKKIEELEQKLQEEAHSLQEHVASTKVQNCINSLTFKTHMDLQGKQHALLVEQEQRLKESLQPLLEELQQMRQTLAQQSIKERVLYETKPSTRWLALLSVLLLAACMELAFRLLAIRIRDIQPPSHPSSSGFFQFLINSFLDVFTEPALVPT